MKILILLCLLFFFGVFYSACNERGPLSSKDYEFCYTGATDRDSALLYYNLEGEIIRGEMWARYFGMEPMKGKVKGFWQGDTLQAEWHARLGDTLMIREVLFFRHPEGFLTEGFGDRYVVDGKSVYRNSSFLHFDHVLQLHKGTCR